MGSPQLSVIIPAFNEASRISLTLERVTAYLRERNITAEVIVADDGSTDATPDLVNAFISGKCPVRLVSLPHRGKGAAVKAGMLLATGDFKFLCDADLSMPIGQLEGFVSLIQHADVVVGSREADGARRLGEPPLRHVMGRVLNLLIRTVGGVRGIADTQCGFKMFRREAAEILFGLQTLDAFGFDIEILYLAQRLGMHVEELGVDWYHQRDSKVRPIHDSLRILGEILTIRANHALGKYHLTTATKAD